MNNELSVINILKRLQKLTALTLSVASHSADKEEAILKDARSLYNGYAGVPDDCEQLAHGSDFDEKGHADIYALLDERIGTGTL